MFTLVYFFSIFKKKSNLRNRFVFFKKDHRFSFVNSSFPDYKTDSIIQATLRHQMGSDVTIITVAHRLQTIMDADRIVWYLTVTFFYFY